MIEYSISDILSARSHGYNIFKLWISGAQCDRSLPDLSGATAKSVCLTEWAEMGRNETRSRISESEREEVQVLVSVGGARFCSLGQFNLPGWIDILSE